ncbi:hypothetical protein [Massilia sp. TS11]|uniref:hypothetical protein n=1 Tax=Massilia sp. TS11 TaxID=2908003 RepID=UPI001EDBB163|nr:hypothetical protein [Massilia sp. TS11]MCG2583050.1 hypothetical protein [Massilia sp. TS11]
MKILFLTAALLAAPVSAHQSQGSPLSRASELAADGSAMVVAGSATVLSGGAALAVASIAVTAEGTVLVLENLAAGASVAVRLSGKAAEGLSLAVGSTVEVSVLAAGTVLSAAGKILCLIPNARGQALLHQSRVAS